MRLFLLQDPQCILRHHPVTLCVQLAGIVYVFTKLDVLEQYVREMDRLYIVRRQLIFGCGDDLRALLGGAAVRVIVRFAVPQLFKISGVDVRFLQRFEQIVIAVSTLLHIETIETEVITLRGGRIVIAHPLHQILHFFGAIDGKAGGRECLRRRAVRAVNITVDCLAAAEVSLQCKGTHAVFFYQHLKYIQPQLLKFLVSVGRLTQGDNLCFIGDSQFGNRCGVF